MFGMRKRRFSAQQVGNAAREFERWISECLEDQAPTRQIILFNLALQVAAPLREGLRVTDDAVFDEIASEVIPNFYGPVRVALFVTDGGERGQLAFEAKQTFEGDSEWVRLIDEGQIEEAMKIHRKDELLWQMDITELFRRMIPIRWETITDRARGNAFLRFFMLLRDPSESMLSPISSVSAKWQMAGMILTDEYVKFVKAIEVQVENATRDFRQGLRA